MMRARGAALVAAAAVLAGEAAAPARASGQSRRIAGFVEVRREMPSDDARPAVGAVGMPPQHGAPDRRRSVVYLETAPRGAFELREGARAVMDQRNETFVPYVLAVTAGTTVEFTNSDRTYHNVFSFSKGNRFDLGRYGRGRSKSVRFDRPGIVRVFCDIHSHMSAFILVFGHRFFSVTSAEGRYQIDGVPPGTYTLVAWNEGQARDSRTVTVPDAAGVEVDFVLK
jgi:plastocyanin